MTLEVLECENEDQELMLNGFAIIKGSTYKVQPVKEVLEKLISLHRTTAYEEHGINKATGTIEHHLIISIHVTKWESLLIMENVLNAKAIILHQFQTYTNELSAQTVKQFTFV